MVITEVKDNNGSNGENTVSNGSTRTAAHTHIKGLGLGENGVAKQVGL